MEQRPRFIRDHRLALYTIAELCARYGISRKTGYKWLARFEEAGRQGLRDRRRAPHHCSQHRAFTAFRRLDNEERPHEFLAGRPPASRYRASPRPYTGVLPPIEYPGHFLVKRITSAGTFRFKHRLPFLSHALEPHPIGLEEVDDGLWSIHFCGVLLARFDERDYVIRP